MKTGTVPRNQVRPGQEHKLNVLILGAGTHREFGFASLRGSGCFVGVVDDIVNYTPEHVDWYVPFRACDVPAVTDVIRNSGIEWHVILCWGEFALETSCAIARELGIAGADMDTKYFRNKYMMRRKLSRAGMRMPAFAIAEDYETAASWMRDHRWPVVVKPVDFAGSASVTLVSKFSELKNAVECAQRVSFSSACLLEEYLPGAEISVETVTFSPGVHRTLGITEKQLGPLPRFVELGHVFPAKLDDHTGRRIIDEVNTALDVLGMRRGSSHAELRLTPDGPTIVEIAGRLGGDFIPRLVCESTGANPYLVELEAISGLHSWDYYRPATRTAAVRFLTGAPNSRMVWPDTGSTIGTLLEHTLIDLGHWCPSGVQSSTLKDSNQRIGYCIVAGPRPDVMKSLGLIELLQPKLLDKCKQDAQPL